jgi:hypothetical protein
MTSIPQAAINAATAALRSEGTSGQLEALAAIVLEAAAPHLTAAKLHPAENMTLTIAKAQLERGENPPINTTAMLAMTVERLAGIRDYQADIAEPIGADQEPGELGSVFDNDDNHEHDGESPT